MTDLYHTHLGTHAMDLTPHLCPVCKRMRYWFVNDGETRCIGCKIDEELSHDRPHP